MAWLVTFTITVAVEVAVAYPLLGLAVQPRRPRLVAILLANVLTHPLVYVLASSTTSPLLVIPILELGATVVEALVYQRRLGRVAPFVLLPSIFASCFANAMSVATSLVFWQLAACA